MKIALISEHASPLASPGSVDSGGQNVYVAQVAAQLVRRGHRVDVFTRRDHPEQAPVVYLAPNLRVVHVPAGPSCFVAKEALLPCMAEFARQLVEHCRPAHRRYDVVHANFFMSGLVALALRRALGLPFVITFHALGKVRRLHQGQADGFPPERIAIEQELVDEADRIIAECPQDHADLVELYGADPERIEIVPCGFDPAELGPGGHSLRRSFGLAEDDFVVLQLGRLVPRKGIDNVIRALALLKREHGIAGHLLVVGGEAEQPDPRLTPEIGRLATLAEREGVREQVIFTGRQPRHLLRDFYCSADVFVTTPWYEPFGITPLEAMACGCPVIGAEVGGIKYSVVDAVTGFLVAPRDPAALAGRLAQLRHNPELGRAMGRAGMRRVRAAFTWKQVVGRLLGVYAAVQAPQPQSRALTLAAGMAAP